MKTGYRKNMPQKWSFYFFLFDIIFKTIFFSMMSKSMQQNYKLFLNAHSMWCALVTNNYTKKKLMIIVWNICDHFELNIFLYHFHVCTVHGKIVVMFLIELIWKIKKNINMWSWLFRFFLLGCFLCVELGGPKFFD